MNKKEGFTLVETIAVVAILAILGAVAGIGTVTMLQKQRQKLAYAAETTIADASVSYYANKGNIYIKACTNSDGDYVTISQKTVEEVNKYLRETKFTGRTGNDLYQDFKNYSINGNSDSTNRHEIYNIVKVMDPACYNTITVGELIEKGLLSDPDGMCNKASLVIVYRRADAKNTAGVLDSVQEEGICKSNRKQERGPVITITPYADLAYSSKKIINIVITTENSVLKDSFVLQYAWSKNNTKKPSDSEWQNLEFKDNESTKASNTLEIQSVSDVKYLWIKGGTELDDKKNKTSNIIAGPYAFLATPEVTYKLNGGNTGVCPATKTVVFSRPYGQNISGINEELCEPVRTGYTFKGWTYKDTDIIIDNDTIVGDKNNHDLTAQWDGNNYTIKLKGNGATTEASPTTLSVEYDSSVLNPGTITLPARTYRVRGFELSESRKSNGATVSSTSDLLSNYSLKGWYTNPTGGSIILDNSSTPTLQAGADILTDSDGKWSADEDADAYAQWTGGAVTLPTITKTGYNCGWTISPSKTTIDKNSGASYTPTSNTDMYGVCIPKNYTISYTLDGGKNSSSNPNSYTIETNDITLENATKTDYTFMGWSGSNGNTPVVGAKVVKGSTGNLTFKANWCESCTPGAHANCNPVWNSTGCTYSTSCDPGYYYSSGKDTKSPVCNK